MKILYDYQILVAQRYGGISRYYYELMRNINQNEKDHADVICFNNRNYYFQEYFPNQRDKFGNIPLPTILNKIRGKLIREIHQWITIRTLNRKYDIFHPTYYNPYMINKTNKKMVVTVYDMISEIYHNQFDDGERANKKAMMYAADCIIAISECTKQDIMKIYPDIPASKIVVIPLATNMQQVKNQSLRSELPEKYILFTGNRSGYKNFAVFVKGVLPVLREDPELNVICTGGGPFKDEEINMMGEYAGRFIQKNYDDEMLAAAYSYAACFVFPSKYEGFGIPTLEAFACDCPTILSNSSCMPEVGGDAVCYFDPNNSQELTGCIQKVLSDTELRNEMIAKGRKQLKKFSWENTAKKTLECYACLLSKAQE